MSISPPDPMRDDVQDRIESGHYASVRDHVRDLIRRDQGGVDDEKRWLRGLDASVEEALARNARGGGIDLDAACDAVSDELATTDSQSRR